MGFAVEGKRFCHRQKTVLHSTCATLVRTLHEPRNKQYSFRGPFRPGNFFETASPLFSRLPARLSRSLFPPFYPCLLPVTTVVRVIGQLFNRPPSMNGDAAVRGGGMSFARTRKVLNCRTKISTVAMVFFLFLVITRRNMRCGDSVA